MSRQKLTDIYSVRTGCALKPETYDMLKAYSKLSRVDIGTILRNIIETHVENNRDKYEKAVVILQEAEKVRVSF